MRQMDTSLRTKTINVLSRQDCLLITWAKASLSVKNKIDWLRIFCPRQHRLRKMGGNSKTAMLRCNQRGGHSPFSHTSLRKKYTPLKAERKPNQTRKSFLTSQRNRMKWWGRKTPWVKSYKRLRKAVSGVTTVVAKFSRPIKDYNSWSWTFLRVRKAVKVRRIWWLFLVVSEPLTEWSLTL